LIEAQRADPSGGSFAERAISGDLANCGKHDLDHILDRNVRELPRVRSQLFIVKCVWNRPSGPSVMRFTFGSAGQFTFVALIAVACSRRDQSHTYPDWRLIRMPIGSGA